MFTELEEFLNINIEEKTKEEVIREIKDCLEKRIEEEKDFFYSLALYGINSIIKITEICPLLNFDKIIEAIYEIFLSYLENEKYENKYQNDNEEILRDIYSKINEEYACLNIIDFSKILIKDKTKASIFSLSCLININNGMSIILLSLLAISLNKKLKLVFEYDNDISKENHLDLFQKFYSEIYSYLISEFYKDNVFSFSYINHRFSIQFINNKNEYLSQNKEEKNNFEIITYYIKDNDRKMKNINIKQYLKETYNFKNMEEINSLIK